MFDYNGDVADKPAEPVRQTPRPTVDQVAPLEVDPVGQREIGHRLGERPQTVSQWHFRGRLPPPRWTVSGRPAWNWPDIEQWARETGRLDARPAKPTLKKTTTSGAERRRRGSKR